MSNIFKRTKEDFTCEHCGAHVVGNGYTNHCPKCLWGKHVDVHPGDRAEKCCGMMEPIGVEVKKGGYSIISRCVKCGIMRNNKTAPDDNSKELQALMRRNAVRN